MVCLLPVLWTVCVHIEQEDPEPPRPAVEAPPSHRGAAQSTLTALLC